jgi:hypothetical protein
VWLLYGIQPHGARHSMTPGRCKGKAHPPEHLGIAGRRVLVSRKWSNKTLDVPLCSTSTRIAQWYISAVQSPNRRASGGGGGGRFRRFRQKSQVSVIRNYPRNCANGAQAGENYGPLAPSQRIIHQRDYGPRKSASCSVGDGTSTFP